MSRGIEITRQDDVVVARLEGEVDLANTPTDVAGLVVDLCDVRYIDSVGIRMLFTFVRSLHAARQGMSVAVAPDSPVRKLLKITHLDEAVMFRSTADEACGALREGGAPQY